MFLTMHCLLHEDGTGLAGSLRRKEPSSLGSRLQGCSLSLAPCAQGCFFPPSLRVQGCSSLVPEIHLQGFFGLRAQRKVGKPELLLPSLCWRGNSILHIYLLYLRGFLPVGVTVSGVQSQRAEHMALVRLCTQLPSPLTAAQASTHLMSYANPRLPESWDFLLFSFTLIFECLALEDVKKS